MNRLNLKYDELEKIGYILITNNEDAIEFFNVESSRKIVIAINEVFKNPLMIFDENESLNNRSRQVVCIYQVNDILDDECSTITFQELIAIHEFLLDSHTVKRVDYECNWIKDYQKLDKPTLVLKEIGWHVEKARWDFYQFYKRDNIMSVSLLGEGFVAKIVPNNRILEKGFSFAEISYFSQFIQHNLIQWQKNQAQKNFYKQMDENR